MHLGEGIDTDEKWLISVSRSLLRRIQNGHGVVVKVKNNGVYVTMFSGNDLSPIVLFVYNRPDHTKRTLEALKANDFADRSTLYVYSDGPKHMALKEDVVKIKQIRDLVQGNQWCGEVYLVESERNCGLADSIVSGVTEVVNKHGRVIVLEDDIVTSPGFLRYMNDALELYAEKSRVMHVSAFQYPIEGITENTTVFSKCLSCWGWGTWKRAWDHYSHDIKRHIDYFGCSPKAIKKFNLYGHAPFFKQLQQNQLGQIYTWAVRWYASWLRQDGLSLFPCKSFVQNIGFDKSGVHCKPSPLYEVLPVDYLSITKIPCVEDIKVRKAIDRYYKENLGKKEESLERSLLSFCKRKVVQSALLLLRPIRILIRYAYPELQQLDITVAQQTGVYSSVFGGEVSPKAHVKPPYHLNTTTVGDYTYIMPNSWISMADIGKFCSIGPRFMCGAGIHPVDGLSTAPMFYSIRKQNGITLSGINKCVERKKVTIGNDVFIGMNVTVLDGVTINDGAVIGAGCVVSKDVPPYAIAVGNPMKILRYRFDEETRAKLLSIKWWDWPEEQLQEVERHFFAVEEFIERYRE